MNYEELKDNIVGLVQESQIKLGYTETAIHFYYPAEAINSLLDIQLLPEELETVLQAFSVIYQGLLGQLTFTRKGEMFCITVPQIGVKYVHEHVKSNGFLEEFIALMADGHCSIEEVLAVFQKYSSQVSFQETVDEEFDYLIYFTEGIPDSYRYCLHKEFGHMTYHRFTPKEFQKLYHA